jgi:hypothetical protein
VWAASREICSPPVSVIRSGSPCAVDQTTWTMFPRSKRPELKASCRSTASAEKPAPKAAIAVHSAA